MSQDPALCSAAGTRALVLAFVRAFNGGDNAALNRLWAGQGAAYTPGFRWYTAFQDEPPIEHQVFSRARLLPYFATRHRRGERLRILGFRFNGNGGNGYGNLEYRLKRTATDLDASSQRYDGKGALVCSPGRRALAVWSMGTV